MRYKVLVNRNWSSGLISPHKPGMVEVVGHGRDTSLPECLKGDTYPFIATTPDDALSLKHGGSKNFICFELSNGIFSDDSGNFNFTRWVYIPETHPLFNVDILYNNSREFKPTKTLNEVVDIVYRVTDSIVEEMLQQNNKYKHLLKRPNTGRNI